MTSSRPTMAAHSLLIIIGLVLLLSSLISVDAQLRQNFYSQTCPLAESIVSTVVRNRIKSDRTLAAGLLRLHFHDCFVLGCEAGVLLDSTPGNLAEKDAPPNKNSLRGFDVIDQAKAAVEKQCKGVVSCADILALAARDSVQAIGGPSWLVPTGRRDGTISRASIATADLPQPGFSFAQLKKNFAKVGLNEKDLGVLSAGHTIGFSKCTNFISRLYNFPNTADGIDPRLDKNYALQLRKSCPPNSGPNNVVPLDPTGGGQSFDTGYYNNVLTNKALFSSDENLLTNPGTRNLVVAERNSPSTFFSDFATSMEKMGRIGVLTTIGEIRLNCHKIN